MDFFTFLKPKNDLEVPATDAEANRPFVPDAMWMKCPKCSTLLLASDTAENNKVCTKCGYHFRLNARERIKLLTDTDSFSEMDANVTAKNFLNFPEYNRKLKNSKIKSSENESVITGTAKMGGIRVVICAMEPNFVMGSMGSACGEKITRAFEYATTHLLPVIVCTVSGGARMQEGILSLMQMAKTSGAVKLHSDAGLLYITVLTDPTTGGVTASFAMEGDIIISEPSALVAFAGPRVIEQTIRQKLPKDFQTAEFLLEKGFIDAVVKRSELKATIVKLLDMHQYTAEEVTNNDSI